jgi:hypothetical protein
MRTNGVSEIAGPVFVSGKGTREQHSSEPKEHHSQNTKRRDEKQDHGLDVPYRLGKKLDLSRKKRPHSDEESKAHAPKVTRNPLTTR